MVGAAGREERLKGTIGVEEGEKADIRMSLNPSLNPNPTRSPCAAGMQVQHPAVVEAAGEAGDEDQKAYQAEYLMTGRDLSLVYVGMMDNDSCRMKKGRT